MPLIAMSNAPAPFQAEGCSPAYGPYFLCGWKLNSALPLPELLPWSAPGRQEPARLELCLMLGPACSAEEIDSYRYEVEPDGGFLLQLPGLGIFRIAADAATVTLRPLAGVEPQLLRAHFYGSVVAVLCFLHRLLPLHGACVSVGDAAVIFTGPSGAGKSTLAAAFVREGYPLLCDDVCALDVRGGAKVWPAFPRVKLLPDAIDAFELDHDTLYTQAVHGLKGHFLLGDDRKEFRQALPVSAIYLLHSSPAATVEITPLRGAAAFLPLKTQVHRASMGTVLGLRGRIFHDLSTLLQTVPVFQLGRPMDLERIGEGVRGVVRRQAENDGTRSA